MTNFEDMTEEELREVFDYYTEEKKRDYRHPKFRIALDMLHDIQKECDERGIDFRPESFQPFWYK